VDPDEPDEGPGDAPDAQSAEEEEAEELEGGDVARFVRELARETPARRREMVEELREDYPKLATIVDHALVQADALAKEEEDEEEDEDEDEL
jgi:short-subunit dehydrogenase involved in D-alanine esterification of teichoic acids